MKTKVWDVVAPKNKWERDYAKLEYKRIVWHDLWQACTYIEVKRPWHDQLKKDIETIEEFAL